MHSDFSIDQTWLFEAVAELKGSCPALRCRERRLKPDETFIYVSDGLSVRLCSRCFLKLAAAVSERLR